MNKIATYIFLTGLFLIKTTLPAHASTDYIIYAFNMVGVYTGIAQEVVNKVSQYERMITSAKTMIGGYLGDKVAAAKEKVELAQEKVENAQEKMEKVKERIEWAKEKKEALMAKHNEINSKIAEYKEKASEAIAIGQEIRETYKTYKNKITEYKDMAMEYKDKAMEYKDKAVETLNDVKDVRNQVSEEVGIVKDVVGSKTTPKESNQSTKNLKIESQGSESKASTQSPKVLSNQADTIMSAGALAEQSQARAVSFDNVNMLEQDVSMLQQNSVSAADVLEAAKTKPSDSYKEEVQSNLNLEDQLMQFSTKTDAESKTLGTKEIIETKEILLNRERFDTAEEKQEKVLKTTSNEQLEKTKKLSNKELLIKKGSSK